MIPTAVVTTLAILAGGLGAAARFALDTWLRARLPYPHRWGLGLVVVNVTGSFALGLLMAAAGSTAVTIAGTGFLGGYTTFSSASLDSAQLAMAGRGRGAMLHAAGTAAACVAAAALGLLVG